MYTGTPSLDRAKALAIISTHLNVESIDLNASLAALGLDEQHLPELHLELSHAFDIDLPHFEHLDLKEATVNSLIDITLDALANTFVPPQIAVVSGVLNKSSIAWHIAQAMIANGIQVVYLVQDTLIDRVKEKRILPDNADIVPYDATNSALVKKGADYIARTYGAINYLVHAVAYSDKAQLEGSFLKLTKENFINTMVISAYSFVEMCEAYRDIMADNGSISTLTFLGSQFVAANYGPMGMAKAALESAVGYTAQELGERGIRVNAMAPGPVKTLAASGIGEFELSLYMGAARSATGKNVTAEEVGRTIFKVMQCEGITGGVISIDNGIAKTVGMGTSKKEKEAYRAYREQERIAAKAAKQAEPAE